MVSYNYKCLHRDTAALATLALRSKVSSMLLYGGDLREVTILILTASLLGIPLTVCDEKVTPNGELTDALSSPCLVIAPPSVTTDLPTKHIGIEHAQFIAAIEGEDDSFPAFIPLSDRFSITFITKNGRECYGSSSIAFSARGFSASCRLIRG